MHAFWSSQCHSDRNTLLNCFHLYYTKGYLVQVSGLLQGARKPPKQGVSVLCGKGNQLQLLCDSLGSSRRGFIKVWTAPRRWGLGSWGAMSNCRGISCNSSRHCSTSGTLVRATLHLAIQAEAYLILSIHICCNGWSIFVPSETVFVIC